MQNKLIYLVLLGLLSVSAFFFYRNHEENEKISQLKEIIVEDNQVLGSLYDHRDDQKIEDDILCKMGCAHEINTLSFTQWKTLGPDHARLVGWDDQTMNKELTDINDAFKKLVGEFKEKFGSKATVQYRQKTLLSVIGKLKEKNKVADRAVTLKKLSDLGGIRLTFNCFDDLEPVKEEIKKDYHVLNADDYFTNPKKSGYRSYHMDIAYKHITVEIQLRTVGIDLWSSWDHDLLYKNNDKILKTVGKDNLEAFHAYSKQLIDYIYNYEQETPIALPVPPEGISILWDLAGEKEKKIMTPQGIPNLKLLPPPSCKNGRKQNGHVLIPAKGV